MLRDVTTKVTDGLLGLPTAKGTGIHVKIGVSSVTSEEPIIITGNMNVATIRERLGYSPLADKVMDSVENGSDRLYCIPVAASTAGTITKDEDEEDLAGDPGLYDRGTVSLSGSPYNAFDVVIQITGRGGLNSALFIYSLDGGYSYSDDLTVPLSGQYSIEEAGLVVKFEEGPVNTESFHVDDEFRFTTTAPTMTNAEALAAIDKLAHFEELYEFVHIVGEAEPATWAAIAAKQLELRDTYKKPLAFILEAYAPAKDEKVGDYALRLDADKKKVKNYDVQIVAARSLYVGMDGVTRDINNAGIVCGLYSKTSVHQSVGRTEPVAGMAIPETKMLELRPKGIEEHIEFIDAAQYVTFREYGGLDGYYVYNARMMAPDGSDYRYMEDTRVKNKIMTEVRTEGMKLLQTDIDLENQQKELETLAQFMTTGIDEMVRLKEISSYTVSVPEDQDIIETETMEVVVRYVSKGYVREIVVDIGRTKPSA